MGKTAIDGGLGIPRCILPGTPEDEARKAGFIERHRSEQLILFLNGENGKVRWRAAQTCSADGEESTLDT